MCVCGSVERSNVGDARLVTLGYPKLKLWHNSPNSGEVGPGPTGPTRWHLVSPRTFSDNQDLDDSQNDTKAAAQKSPQSNERQSAQRRRIWRAQRTMTGSAEDQESQGTYFPLCKHPTGLSLHWFAEKITIFHSRPRSEVFLGYPFSVQHCFTDPWSLTEAKLSERREREGREGEG